MADDIPEFDPNQPSTPVISGAGTRRTGAPTREMLRPDEPRPVEEPIPEFDPSKPSTPVPQRSWSDVPLEAVKSIPHSAVEFGKNIIQPFIHPIETAQSLGALGGGVLQHLGIMKGDEYKEQASAVGKYLMDRYTTEEGIKHALATDPVGIAADLSILLTGGGSAAARIPGMAGKIGEVAATTGRAIDPLRPIIGAAKAVGTGVGHLGAELAGTSTHVGSEPFIQAAKAGYEGGEAARSFRENITGRVPVGDAAMEAHRAVQGMGQARGAAYRAGLAEVDLDKTILNFNKIDQALADTTTVATFKGRPLDIPGGEVQKTRQAIGQAVQDWKMLPPAEYHTPAGLNALKRQIDSIREATPWGSPERLVGDMAHHAIVNSIVDQMAAIPGGQAYAKMLRGYTDASDSLKTIAREMSVPSDKSKLNIDQALRKLQSALRDNVNSSFGRRKELADFLVANGAPNLMYKLAGQSLKPWAPRGLGKVVFNIGSMIAAFSGAGVGAAVGAGMLQSPRILGNVTFRGAQGAGLVGRGTRPIRKYLPRGTSYQVGRLANESKKGADGATRKGYAYGGAVFPVGREGIQARNKARAFEARERSSFTRGAAKAKGKVKFADGGVVSVGGAVSIVPRKMKDNDAVAEGAERAAVARAGQETQAAVMRAARRGLPVDPPSLYSQILQREVAETNAASRANERLMWQSLDPEARLQVNMTPVAEMGGRIYGEMTPDEGASLSPAEIQIARLTQQYGPVIPFREMQDIRSIVSGEMRQELCLRGKTPMHARLAQLQKTIDQSVTAPFEQRVQPISYADGGLTRGSEGGVGDAAAAFANNPTLDAIERMHMARKKREQFDPEGTGYDMESARAAGMEPDKTGHWPSRVPDTGLILKGRGHSSYPLTEQGEQQAGYEIKPGEGGRYYSQPRFAEGGEVDVDSSTPDQDMPAGGFEAAAARVRRRAPVREPDPISLAASQGRGAGRGQFLTEGAKGMLELAKTPGRVMQEGMTEADVDFGPQMAMQMMGANAPLAATRPGLGIFGGKGAKTANLPMLKQAEQMLKEGVPHETIRNQTGWEFGPEGKPRFEISDAESRIKPEALDDRIGSDTAASRASGLRPNQRLEDVYHHPAAYEAYPWLKDMRTSLEVGEKVKPAASYAPPDKFSLRGSHGDIEVRAPTYERGGVGDLFERQYASDVGARDMLLHEMTHAIQHAEGFAPGANPRDLRPMKDADIQRLTQRAAEKEGLNWDFISPQDKARLERVIRTRIYKMHAGETEARNVQIRADDELRQRPSWKTEDVARENQIIAKTGKLKPGEKPFEDVRTYKLEHEPSTETPLPGSKEWRDAPNPNAPFPQYAENYPPVGPPVATTFKNVNKKTGEVTYKEGFSKEQTPQAKAFMKERARIIKDMDENGYHPYFDENQRFDVDPINYPLNTDTINIVPKTLNKLAEHFYKTGAIETRRALQAAYSRGRLIGGGRGPDFVGPGGAGPEFIGPMQRLTTQDWYMMGQLEQELVKRMGPKAGREAFKEKFATSMAATTGGMKPRDNLVAAGYQNYLAAKGQRWPEETHQWPSPVGAEYGSQLSKTAQRIQDEGGFKALGEQNPKRHNFAGDFAGHRKLGTMDEQMTDLMQPGKTQPDWYGVNEHVMAQEAEKAGADPRMFQETGWAGHKDMAGGPMIREVNHTIERIHRLTGMPRSEIVYRAWGLGDIPVYGAAGLAALKALEGQFTGEE